MEYNTIGLLIRLQFNFFGHESEIKCVQKSGTSMHTEININVPPNIMFISIYGILA
jgi:hypothetical protein